MSDEKTREVPLTDVMGIAEVSDEPTETLPAVDDPGEAKTCLLYTSPSPRDS